MVRRLALILVLLGCGKRRENSEPPPRPSPVPPRVETFDAATAAMPPPAAAPGWTMITTIAAGDTSATSVAIDSKNNVVVAVAYKGRTTIGTETLDGEGVALVKLGDGGAVLWTKALAKDQMIEYPRLAIDSKDAIVMTATLRGSVDLGGGALASAGDKDIVLAKLDADGKHVWSKRFGGTQPDRPAEVAVDAKDQIVVAGYYAGSADFGGKKLTGKNDAEMFVARYAADGKLVFANRLSGGGTTQSELYDVAVDASGNAIAIGGFHEKLDIGGTPLAGDSKKALQTFIVAYTPAGRVAWSAAYPGPSSLMNGIVVDRGGNVVLAGTEMNIPVDQNGMVSFDVASGQPSKGSMQSVVGALDADRKLRWSVPVGNQGMGDMINLATVEDDVIVAGDTASAPFNDKSLEAVKTFVARLSADGKVRWARGIPNAIEIVSNPAIATRGATIVIVAGTGKHDAQTLSLLRPAP